MEETKTYTIYKVTNTLDDFVYIGQTTGIIEERWLRHCKEARIGKKQSPLYRAMRTVCPDKDYGKHFRVELVTHTQDAEKALRLEVETIALAGANCYNRNRPVKIQLQTKPNGKVVREKELTDTDLLKLILKELQNISALLSK